MQVARESRGYDARWIWQAKGVRGIGRGAVHPLVRARRAGLPRDGVPRVTTGSLPELDERSRDARACGPAAMALPAVADARRACSRGWCGREPRARARGHAARLRLSRRHQALFGDRPHDRCRRARRAARAERRRQDHAGAAPQRHPHGPARLGAGGRAAGRRRRTCGRSAGASASCSRIPTTSCSCRPCATTSRSAPRTWVCAATSSTRASSGAAGRRHGGVHRPAPHHLSFGQRRRVAVATVLAMEPEILVLDEPSSNLDPAGRRELADILRSLADHDADGHPRPPVRARAVPPGPGDERRRDRRRRADARTSWPTRR